MYMFVNSPEFKFFYESKYYIFFSLAKDHRHVHIIHCVYVFVSVELLLVWIVW